ncbi:hypothetical protein L1S32_03635 [Methanogenium sp. S4BF]|uniref:hypothetical protein n=1 Tax=Methanogenium sp. S4BF TaxID=1789226 RepID=UPI00241660DF|nr:hypothetical protein [Methanogenium sp. S4BF]WFN35223.1 hypothetical protein L1S32_03635 [Methanogenium sp. S4BF]
MCFTADESRLIQIMVCEALYGSTLSSGRRKPPFPFLNVNMPGYDSALFSGASPPIARMNTGSMREAPAIRVSCSISFLLFVLRPDPFHRSIECRRKYNDFREIPVFDQ